MKTAFQLVASALALTGLLFGAAAQATNLAELPLKASVLAKPNVILGMDDSGSMDSEIMLNTSDGVFWWNYDTGRGWDAAGAMYRHVNLGEYWSSTWRRYFYLFPNGNGGGLNIKPDDPNGDWSLPPTSEFAWARSAEFNPQYYNPNVTYAPWSRAYSYSAFTNATASAARGHPIYGGASNVVDLTATRAADTSTSRYFIAVKGMTLPAGASVSECNGSNGGAGCGTFTAVGASDVAAQPGKVTRLAMAYWPATYWVRATAAADCTLPASTVSVAVRDCALAPDGTKLRRVEIRSTNSSYPSGRTYANELQNFANWFQYHRKRRLSANAAMGEVLEGLTGMHMGVVKFNARPATGTRVTMYDLDKPNAVDNGESVLKLLYETDSNVATPTRATLERIGYEFLQPTGPIKFACQRNAALILTDGYANAGDVNPPAYNAATYGSGAPYATTFGGTLADIALSYYTLKLGDSAYPAGKVPTSTADSNASPHMNTYALTLGAKGDLFLGDLTPVPTSTGAWTDPTTDFNPNAIDDLWHATINGRGKMYVATAASETATKLTDAFADILTPPGAQGSVAVSAVNLDRSDSQAYLGQYNPRGWAGDLTANPININTAAVSTTPNWTAATVLGARSWSTRVIFTSSGSTGVDFSAANVGATVNPNAAVYTNDQIVDYLRGNRTGEGTTVRTRTALLGAVINAEPVLARDERIVYVASGEGMLHAFDTATGAEQWAYVPPDMQARMGQSAERGWVFQTLLDAAPTYATLNTGTKLLVGGLGAAGRSYYALDVSAPRGLNATQAAAQFRWIFPATTDTTNRALMGYSVGKPVIGRTAADGNVVLVTSGYDNGQAIGNGNGRLWVLNATTGAVIKTFRTTTGAVHPGAEAGLSFVSAFRESDGTMRYAYGGDLLGNVWKFDLARTGGGELDAELLATLQDPSGNAQPVTAAPELAMVAGRRVVLVGTGRVLDITDFGSSRVQSFYAIADGATLTNARTGLVRQTYVRATDTMSTNTVDWTTDRGWYFDLAAGEQANTDPVVVYGAVAFVTNVNGGADCAQSSYLYLVDIGTGTKTATSSFVSQTISAEATSSRVIALRVVNGRIIGTTHRSDNTVYQRELPVGQVIQPAKNAWREIRR